MYRKLAAVLVCLSIFVTGCALSSGDDSKKSTDTSGAESAASSGIDMGKWKYESDADVYYQVGLNYVEKPVDTTYETMGIYVPGAYFDATDNGDDTYTCKVKEDAEVGSYTPETAPMVIPVNTPGY